MFNFPLDDKVEYPVCICTEPPVNATALPPAMFVLPPSAPAEPASSCTLPATTPAALSPAIILTGCACAEVSTRILMLPVC